MKTDFTTVSPNPKLQCFHTPNLTENLHMTRKKASFIEKCTQLLGKGKGKEKGKGKGKGKRELQ